MEVFNDSYQNKIDEARAKLSKESREAIDNINWKLIILGMKNYTSDQLDDLEMETELLLYGITNPEDYPYELQTRMHLTKEDTEILVRRMQSLIFSKIEDELKTILERKRRFENKQDFLDPRFSTLPLSVQKAISKSNWRSNLYEISQKYKLNIEEMGILEKITVRVIKNEITGDNYLNELTSNINKTKEELAPVVADVNQKIILEIRELLKKEQEEKPVDTNTFINNSSFDKIPLPPYSRIRSERSLDLKPLRMKTEDRIVENKNIVNNTNNIKPNIIQPITLPNKNENKKEVIVEDIKIPEPPKNMLEEKLKGVTLSTGGDTNIKKDVIGATSRQADPYREPF